MKQLKLIILLLGMTHGVYAQGNSSQKRSTSNTSVIVQAKMDAIQDCEELHKQLTDLFGIDYSVSNPKVLVQLQKNIANQNASTCIRKKSLYGIYGEDYVKHLDLINQGNIQNKSKN